MVLFDALTDPALRELAPQARWIDVGKRGFCDMRPARRRSTRCWCAMRASGRAVVRLKGGDPSVFGRLEEELEALAAAGIDCEVVPGVTAAHRRRRRHATPADAPRQRPQRQPDAPR